MNTQKTHHGNWRRLIRSALIYLALGILAWLISFIFAPQHSIEIAGVVYTTFAKVLWIIISVFILIGILQVWVTPEQISAILGKEAGFKGLLLSATIPMVLGGSLFVIFPLLKTLHQKGARTSTLVAFLFAWSAKAPLLPLEIKFLGLKFALLRLVFIPVLAISGGLVAEWIIDRPLRNAEKV